MYSRILRKALPANIIYPFTWHPAFACWRGRIVLIRPQILTGKLKMCFLQLLRNLSLTIEWESTVAFDSPLCQSSNFNPSKAGLSKLFAFESAMILLIKRKWGELEIGLLVMLSLGPKRSKQTIWLSDSKLMEQNLTALGFWINEQPGENRHSITSRLG